MTLTPLLATPKALAGRAMPGAAVMTNSAQELNRQHHLPPLPGGEREGPATTWWEGEGVPEWSRIALSPLIPAFSPQGRRGAGGPQLSGTQDFGDPS